MSGRFEIQDTALAGVKRITRMALSDSRGFLERLYCPDELADAGFAKPIAQINRTFTRHRGTVRGLHFQLPPHAESKIVSCLRGEVFDVAVDLRAGSPTFLKWHGEILNADNRRMLLIPEGCAHGAQALSDDCEMLYFHTAAHAPEAEGGIHPEDATLAISWPLPVAELSARDANLARLSPSFSGIHL